MLARRSAEVIAGWEKEDASLKAGVRWARERLSETRGRLSRHLQKSGGDHGLAEARQRLDDGRRELARVIGELSRAELELERDAAQRRLREGARREAAAARAAADRWAALDARIGSADGLRFARHALLLRFKRLAAFASEELVRLTGRLALFVDAGEPFAFGVVDDARGCERRPLRALSAQELLAARLAMAIGLSEMNAAEGGAVDAVFVAGRDLPAQGAALRLVMRRAAESLQARGRRVMIL